MVQLGDAAPSFSLSDQRGTPVDLETLLGQGSVVLYFYPLDETPGCNLEACGFRDAYQDFRRAGAEVVGVSSQSVRSHEIFAANHELPFPLLADVHGALRHLYGVPRTLGLLPGRVTYVIDRRGIIRHIVNSQLHITRHIAEALEVVRHLDGPHPVFQQSPVTV